MNWAMLFMSTSQINTATAKKYNEICRSAFGEAAFEGLQEFARLAKRFVPDVTLTVVDRTVSEDEKTACRQIAEKCGVAFRVRAYIE